MDDEAPLYARILRDDWGRLAAAVRCLHATAPVARARGRFRVRHGGHPLARLIARLLRLPPAADVTDTRLIVSRLGDGERWERAFEATRIVTRQVAVHASASAPEPELVEYFGLIELRFRLDVSEGSLRYHQRDAAVRWRSVRLPIPARLAPRIEAREDAVGPAHVKVDVHVTLPLIGTLMIYDGIVDVEREGARA